MERNGRAAGMDLYSAMNEIEERKEALWTAWTEHGDFESALRLVLQEVEERKLESPELNVSVSYHLGRLEGYAELFEQLFRAKAQESALQDEPALRTDKARRILRALYQAGELRHGELAGAVESSYSSLTNMMKKVLLSGAVEVSRSGRNTRYRLTEAGRRYCERNLLGKDRFFDRIYEAAFEGASRGASQRTRDVLPPPAVESVPPQGLNVGDLVTLKVGNEIYNSVELKAVANADMIGINHRYAEFGDGLENAEEEETPFARPASAALGMRMEV